MTHAAQIEPHADSLIELLTAQCADLEQLLALARRETDAAERRDFDEIMRLTNERATLGERLEVFHRQLAELRARMGEGAEAALRGRTAERVTQLAVAVQSQ
ncbi:MAG: flagellar export chaperone FlgN, partial [Pyrinomonadaceae bacterium]